MYTEQRRSNRVRRELPLRVGSISVAEQGAASAGRNFATTDVSPTGLCFRSATLFQPGSHLQIRVELGREGSFPVVIEHKATVHWCKQEPRTASYLVGVEFSASTQEEKRKWMEHLNFRSESIY